MPWQVHENGVAPEVPFAKHPADLKIFPEAGCVLKHQKPIKIQVVAICVLWEMCPGRLQVDENHSWLRIISSFCGLAAEATRTFLEHELRVRVQHSYITVTKSGPGVPVCQAATIEDVHVDLRRLARTLGSTAW